MHSYSQNLLTNKCYNNFKSAAKKFQRVILFYTGKMKFLKVFGRVKVHENAMVEDEFLQAYFIRNLNRIW